MRIDGIEDLNLIGEGGFARVYHGRQTAFRRDVAVKVLNAASISDTERARFERECLAAGSVAAHPNIVSIHHAGSTDDGSPYLVMDFVSGGSLAEQIRRGGPLDEQTVIRHGVALAGALESAHRSGVIHRDVKPENILIDAFGSPLLADFGISLVDEAFQTQSGVISATLAHAAPEVVGGRRATASSDVYSLGSALHATLTGRSPFERTSDEHLAAVIARILTEVPPDLATFGIDPALARVVGRALAKDPADRWPTALALGDALAEVGSRRGIDGLRVPVLGPAVDHRGDPPAASPLAVAALEETRQDDTPPANHPAAHPSTITVTRRRGRPLLIAAVVAFAAGAGVIGWQVSDAGSPEDPGPETTIRPDEDSRDATSDGDVGTDDEAQTETPESPEGETVASSIALPTTTTDWGGRVDRRLTLDDRIVLASITVTNPTDAVIAGSFAEFIPEVVGAPADIEFDSISPPDLRADQSLAWFDVTLGPLQVIVIGYVVEPPSDVDVLATWHREALAAIAELDEDGPTLRARSGLLADGMVEVTGRVAPTSRVTIDGVVVDLDRRGRFASSVAFDAFPVRVVATDPIGRERTRLVAGPEPEPRGPVTPGVVARPDTPEQTVVEQPPTPTPVPEPTPVLNPGG